MTASLCTRSSSLGFGLEIAGWGRYLQNAPLMRSTFEFGSEDPKSLITHGRGVWLYERRPEGTFFKTVFDYETRHGVVGELLDFYLFRPVMQLATAWSFETLRRWCAGDEQAVAGAVPGETAIAHGLALSLGRVLRAGWSLLRHYAWATARGLLLPRGVRRAGLLGDRQVAWVLLASFITVWTAAGVYRRGVRSLHRGQQVGPTDGWPLLAATLGEDVAQVDPRVVRFYSNPGAYAVRASVELRSWSARLIAWLETPMLRATRSTTTSSPCTGRSGSGNSSSRPTRRSALEGELPLDEVEPVLAPEEVAVHEIGRRPDDGFVASWAEPLYPGANTSLVNVEPPW